MIGKRYIKFSLTLCFSGGIIFSVFSLLFYFGDWIRLSLVFCLGMFTGALAIPELEPKAVKKPILFQTIVGAIGGCIATGVLGGSIEHVIFGLIAGAVFGMFANVWLKHLPIP